MLLLVSIAHYNSSMLGTKKLLSKIQLTVSYLVFLDHTASLACMLPYKLGINLPLGVPT